MFTFWSKIKFFAQHGKFVAYQEIWANKYALAFVSVLKKKKWQKIKTYYTACTTLSSSEELHYNFPIIISSLSHWTNLAVVLFGYGSLHCCCKAVEVLNDNEALPSFPHDSFSWASSIAMIIPFVLNWLVYDNNHFLLSLRLWNFLAKQLHFNHHVLFKSEEKSAVKIMAVVIDLLLLANSCSLRCSLVYLFYTEEGPCNYQEYKIPLIVSSLPLTLLLTLCS